MQARGKVSDFFVEQPVDQGVNIFVARQAARASGDAPTDAIQAGAHATRLGGREHARPNERCGPRLRQPDVMRPEAMVDVDGAIDCLERWVRAAREASAPELMGALAARSAAGGPSGPRAHSALRRRPDGRASAPRSA